MKIGISDYYYDRTCWVPVEQRYRKFAGAGISFVDFNTAPTDTPIYSTTEEELKTLVKQIRGQIEDAGLQVGQVHGPWC